MHICIYGAASDNIDPAYLTAAFALGEQLAHRGHTLIFGGGAQGIMGATARGAHSAGGKIIGIAPSFFHMQGVLFEQCSSLILTQTMRERKQRMEDQADAFVALPGGIGTLEEFLEILTLKQLRQHNKPIALLNLLGYFDPLIAQLDRAAEQGFLQQDCDAPWRTFSTPGAVLDCFEQN